MCGQRALRIGDFRGSSATAFASKRTALIPFITAGDPDLDATVKLLRESARRGASLIEVGFPYSDPIADGGRPGREVAGDALTMTVFALPMIGLYLLGVGFAWLAARSADDKPAPS
jgi:hypothetical protein